MNFDIDNIEYDELFKEWFDSLDDSEKISIWNYRCSENGYTEDIIFDLDECTFNEIVGERAPWDLIGVLNNVNTSDDYFQYTIYGPESFSYIDDIIEVDDICYTCSDRDDYESLCSSAGVDYSDLTDVFDEAEAPAKAVEEFEEECDDQGYDIVLWPDSQQLMDLPGFEEYAELIDGEYLLEYYGSSAYKVDCDWEEYKNISK